MEYDAGTLLPVRPSLCRRQNHQATPLDVQPYPAARSILYKQWAPLRRPVSTGIRMHFFRFKHAGSGPCSVLIPRLLEWSRVFPATYIGCAVLRTCPSVSESTTYPNFLFANFDSIAAALHARRADRNLGLYPRLTGKSSCGHRISVVWHRLLQSPRNKLGSSEALGTPHRRHCHHSPLSIDS